jgi:hypothetical protein
LILPVFDIGTNYMPEESSLTASFSSILKKWKSLFCPSFLPSVYGSLHDGIGIDKKPHKKRSIDTFQPKAL